MENGADLTRGPLLLRMCHSVLGSRRITGGMVLNPGMLPWCSATGSCEAQWMLTAQPARHPGSGGVVQPYWSRIWRISEKNARAVS